MNRYITTERIDVSIIIPTCNSGKTLGYALKSILCQDYKEFEVIIVDCYSTDKTMDIIEFFKKEMNIKVIKIQSGMLLAKIIGVKASKGEVIIFLDSDHILRPGKLREIVDLVKERYDILFLEEISCSTSYSLTTRLINRYRYELHRLFLKNGIIHSIYPRVFRKSILRDIISLLTPKCIRLINMWEDRIIHLIVNDIYKGRIRFGLVEGALYHIEPATLMHLFKKYIRYGRNAKENKRIMGECMECRYIHSIIYGHSYAKSILSIPLQSFINIIFNPVFLVKSTGYMLGVLT